jgi:hypothetical protein
MLHLFRNALGTRKERREWKRRIDEILREVTDEDIAKRS